MKVFGIGAAIVVLGIAASSGSLYGQDAGDRPQRPGDAPPRPTDTQRPPAQSGQARHADAQAFVNEMTIVNLAEVQLGQMASEKASSSDVKEFGRMMVKDHTAANADLRDVASQLKIQPPAQVDQKHKALLDKLSKLNGSQFDREYINAMVMGHEEVLGTLRARAGAGAPGAHDAHGAASKPSEAHAAGAADASRNTSTPAQDPSAANSPSGRSATASHGDGEEALTQWAAKMMPTVQKHLEHARELQTKVAK